MAAPKILVHIGLPKTATTTLQQQVFPTVAQATSGLIYCGVKQPRGEQESTGLYRVFMDAMALGDFDTFHEEVDRLEEAECLLFSEEMLTVTDNVQRWEDRLKNLSSLLESYDYRILITVRDPIAAIYSYYLERYEFFKQEYPEFSVDIQDHAAMSIYRYASFFPMVETLFKEDSVQVAFFEDLIQSDFERVEQFLDAKICINSGISVCNNKQKTGEYTVVVAKKTFYSIMTGFATERLGLHCHSYVSRICKFFLKPLLSKGRRKYKVPLLCDAHRKQLQEDLFDDLNFFDDYS